MKGKGVKVKRYRHIYRRSRGALLLRGIGTLAVISLLAFVGWSAYAPVIEFLNGLEKPLPVSASVSESQPEQEESSSQSEAEKPLPAQAPFHAAYLPVSALTNSAGLERALAELEGMDINAILFDLKDINGQVLYQSKLLQVETAEAQAAGAYDLERLCKQLKEAGYTPIGRLNAFRDPIGAKLEGAGVRYLDTDVLWLDNSQEMGGKPWLNPYARPARSYLYALMSEAISFGVEQILLDHVCFPSGYGLEYAGYGNVNMSKPEALSSFIEQAQERAASLGASVRVYVTGLAALGVYNDYYGDVNPLTLTDNLVLGTMPSQFGDGFTLGADAAQPFTVERPILQPGQTIEMLLDTLKPALAGKELAGMVQGYTATGSYLHNKVYAASDLAEQIEALESRSIHSYILYHPMGTYPK